MGSLDERPISYPMGPKERNFPGELQIHSNHGSNFLLGPVGIFFDIWVIIAHPMKHQIVPPGFLNLPNSVLNIVIHSSQVIKLEKINHRKFALKLEQKNVNKSEPRGQNKTSTILKSARKFKSPWRSWPPQRPQTCPVWPPCPS